MITFLDGLLFGLGRFKNKNKKSRSSDVYLIVMSYLKEKLVEIDTVSALTFVADYCFSGAGSLILDWYH